MTYKITLSIPDMLHEKLTEWRESFNFSKLFQEALTEAIEKKESFQQRISKEIDMSEVIARLRKEKMKWGNKYFEMGKKEALGWAKTARYETLLYVTRIEEYCDLLSDPAMQQYFKKAYQSMNLIPFPEQIPENDLTDHDKQFLDGWFSGVSEFWTLVKDKI
jgi:hypothetical protein